MKMLWMLMAMTATTQYVSAQPTTMGLSTGNFIHIKQKKAINVDNVCTNFDPSTNTWVHAPTGESPVSINYENLWDSKSVKMIITMKPGYRPQLYDKLYHFIQVSPVETYTRFEADAAAEGNAHLTSEEMTVLYSDVNFAAKSTELEQYCRLQIAAADITQINGTLTFEQTVTLDFLKTCAEQKYSLILHRTANEDETERCKYVTHPSTKLTMCGLQITGNAAATAAAAAADAVECMKACDGYGDLTDSCNAFTFDTLATGTEKCKLYPGTGLNLLNGNFDVSNTATNPNCKLAVPDAGTDMTAYLLDPHTIQGKCYQYVYDGSVTLPTRRRLAGLTNARQLVFDGALQPYSLDYIETPAANAKPPNRVPMSPNDPDHDCTVGNTWQTGFRFNPSATGYQNNCGRFKLRSFKVASADPKCGNLCATDPYCQYAMYSTGGICEHFSYGNSCWPGTKEAKGAWNIARIVPGTCEDSTRTLSTELSTPYVPLSTCGVSGTDFGGYDLGSGHSADSTCTQYGADMSGVTKQQCMNACGLEVNCGAIQFNPNQQACKMYEHGLFYGMSANSCGPTDYSGAVNNHFWTKTQYYVPSKNDDCYPTASGATGAPTPSPTNAPTVVGATNAPTVEPTNAPTVAQTNAPTVPPVAGSGATNAPTPAQIPGWHTGQQYDDSLLVIDFVVTSVQCKCPDSGAIDQNLEHCDVPFYQKVKFTRTEDADHTAETGTLIISDSNLYLLPEQDVLIENPLKEISVNETAFNFGSATIGIQDPNACKPEVSVTSQYVNCGGTNAFVKPYQREEQMTISFKSTSALQMQTVTLKTFDDPDMSADQSTDCVLTNGIGIEGTYAPNSKKCTVETFSAPIDVFWEYATPAQDNGNSPSRAYSFTFDGDQPGGPLSTAYNYYNDATLVLNVIVETTVSQAGARPARRRLGAASSIQLVDDGSRSLRLLSEDSSVETVVLSLPLLPRMGGGGGGLGGLSVGSSNTTNGTVLTIPQTIVNQYHTTHNESAGTISLVLSAVAVTLVVSGMAVWGIRRFRSSEGRNKGASSSNQRVSSESQSYGESTPMLSMRGLHVA